MTTTITRLNELDKREIENCYIIGKLAEESYELPRLGEELKPITYTSNKDPERIVFYIQAISPEPELLLNKLGKSANEVYISFDTHSRRYFESKKLNNAENRLEAYKEHLENKLILFKPRLTYDDKKATYHYNIELIFVDDEKLEKGTYFPVPSMAKVTTSMRFKKILQEGKPFQLTSYNSYMDLPEFIVCDRHVYHFTDPDALKKSQTNPNTFYCNDPKVVIEIPLPENWSYMTKGVYKDISFISYDNAIKVRDMDGKPIIEDFETQNKETETPKGGSNSKLLPSEFDSETQDQKAHLNNSIKEHNFIYRLDYLARKKNLSYSLEDLINFHTSLKTSHFTILGGMSGTGKTELANLYAEALGLKDKKSNLKVISVKPSFTEPSDILGFFNHQSGVFMESETGLVSFLKNAEKNPNELFMVLFDEMNLGQVEHYFSDFISILEFSKGEQRLELVSPNSLCYQPEIKEGILIGDNVLFVGTANFDETTKDFSNRLLDRANVIRLDKPSFVESKRKEENSLNSTSQYEEEEGNELKNITDTINADMFRGWITEERGLQSLKDAELDLLDRIHEEISSFDSQTGVSFRIAKQVGHYMDNIPKYENDPMMPRHVTFDYQIKQRILSKIRGHRDQIDQLVGIYDEHTQKFTAGRLGLIISELEEEEELSISVKFLQQKAKELMRNGYTL
ncbi:McrB family protein [Priestia megaterium]|uniref:McrB family protein n=1 Tax=Priestia megaterium TaxID=1404 RepID=UPI0025709F13|nr:hypothetical protein [Priestia megaterium]WJD83535.1 hypothetical protein QRD24_26920 [Priestia megaterium]